MIILVVPCYNESARLQLDEFMRYSTKIHFLFVDDGSRDGTADMCERACQVLGSGHMAVLRLANNQGKAEAVRQGMLAALTRWSPDEGSWVGFWDADLATPLWEVENMIATAEDEGSEVNSVWASRVYRYGSRILRSPVRHYLGRVFATIINIQLGIESYDSQCGAKLFRPASARLAFASPFISRWIFDVEIALRLKQTGIIEYPVRQWNEIPGSKVKVLRESLRVYLDILKIRKSYLGRR